VPGPADEPLDPDLDLRVSHADRDRVAERLRDAAADGRIDWAELDQRLERAFTAKTYRELAELTADLPSQAAGSHLPAVSSTTGVTPIGATPGPSRFRAVLGEVKRVGRWVVPVAGSATAVMGSVHLDMREAHFAERRATLSCTVFCGDVKIRVGEDVTVLDETTTVMADCKIRDRGGAAEPRGDGPVLTVRGLVVMGSVTVERHGRLERRSLPS